ncbi:protein cbp-1-like [Contarinia nasturtii]|uniref:protein cbp-1-like n=1 Tax=Contarinia nasturtii TaxID=265458 RepID=UPI0012D3DBB5|nr:protein cbp-1-like [Contarinia nasturtii]
MFQPFNQNGNGGYSIPKPRTAYDAYLDSVTGQNRLNFIELSASVLHSYFCRDNTCARYGCSVMKTKRYHIETCEVNIRLCRICRQLLNIYDKHAKRCEEIGCRIPWCQVIRPRYLQKELAQSFMSMSAKLNVQYMANAAGCQSSGRQCYTMGSSMNPTTSNAGYQMAQMQKSNVNVYNQYAGLSSNSNANSSTLQENRSYVQTPTCSAGIQMQQSLQMKNTNIQSQNRLIQTEKKRESQQNHPNLAIGGSVPKTNYRSINDLLMPNKDVKRKLETQFVKMSGPSNEVIDETAVSIDDSTAKPSKRRTVIHSPVNINPNNIQTTEPGTSSASTTSSTSSVSFLSPTRNPRQIVNGSWRDSIKPEMRKILIERLKNTYFPSASTIDSHNGLFSLCAETAEKLIYHNAKTASNYFHGMAAKIYRTNDQIQLQV